MAAWPPKPAFDNLIASVSSRHVCRILCVRKKSPNPAPSRGGAGLRGGWGECQQVASLGPSAWQRSATAAGQRRKTQRWDSESAPERIRWPPAGGGTRARTQEFWEANPAQQPGAQSGTGPG